MRLRFLSHAMGCVDVTDTVHMVRLQWICVCDIAHEWVLHIQITVAPCEQFHKIACQKMQSHSERIAPPERAFTRCDCDYECLSNK